MSDGEAREVLSQYLSRETTKTAVDYASEVVGTSEEMPWVCDIDFYIGQRDEFELGPAITVASAGEVLNALLVLARRKALDDEQRVRDTSLARTERLLQGL